MHTHDSPHVGLSSLPHRLWLSAALLAGLALGISCGEQGEDCVAGYEGCPCAQNTCLDGLSCLSGHCVDPNWTPTGDDAAADQDAGNEDPDDGGSGSADNVAACNALIEELACGGFDLSTAIDCSLYADHPCDIAEYFDCVRDAFTCTDGVPDASGIVDCTNLATCPG